MAQGEAQPHARTVKKKRKVLHGLDGFRKPEPAVTVDGAQVRLVPNPDSTLKLVTPVKTWKRVRIRVGRPLYEPDDFATVFVEGGGSEGWGGRGRGGWHGRGHGHGHGRPQYLWIRA